MISLILFLLGVVLVVGLFIVIYGLIVLGRKLGLGKMGVW